MQATAEANNLAAVASAKDQYYKNMEKVGMQLGISSLHLVSIKKKNISNKNSDPQCIISVTMLNVTLYIKKTTLNYDTSVQKQYYTTLQRII